MPCLASLHASRNQTQVFGLARQALYQLSHPFRTLDVSFIINIVTVTPHTAHSHHGVIEGQTGKIVVMVWLPAVCPHANPPSLQRAGGRSRVSHSLYSSKGKWLSASPGLLLTGCELMVLHLPMPLISRMGTIFTP